MKDGFPETIEEARAIGWSVTRLTPPPIEVFRPGAVASLWGGVKAKVDQVLIEGDEKVSYRIKYWSGSQLQNEWISANMIEMERPDMARVGFTDAPAVVPKEPDR